MTAADDVRPEIHSARAWLVYTALRMVVFVGTAGLFLLLGFNGLALLLVALIVSGLVSLFVLRPQRAAVVAAQEARRQRRAEERETLRSRLDEV